jgi:hypothetical protein
MKKRFLFLLLSISVLGCLSYGISAYSYDDIDEFVNENSRYAMSEENVSSFIFGKHPKQQQTLIKRVDNEEAVCYVYVGIGISCFPKKQCAGDVGDKLPSPGPGDSPCGHSRCS